jgi:hypothetical protein
MNASPPWGDIIAAAGLPPTTDTKGVCDIIERSKVTGRRRIPSGGGMISNTASAEGKGPTRSTTSSPKRAGALSKPP